MLSPNTLKHAHVRTQAIGMTAEVRQHNCGLEGPFGVETYSVFKAVAKFCCSGE